MRPPGSVVFRAYIALYFGLIAGAVVTLYRSGALQKIPIQLVILGVAVAIMLGVVAIVTRGDNNR